jgi:hypothetical protein
MSLFPNLRAVCRAFNIRIAVSGWKGPASDGSPPATSLELNMKTILSAALVLMLCGLAPAADKVDAVGTWKCHYEIGDQKRTSTLTIKQDGDKLDGTMSWPDQKDAKLKDVKLKDKEEKDKEKKDK